MISHDEILLELDMKKDMNKFNFSNNNRIKQVICIKELELNKYDDNGYSTDEYFVVHQGTVFNWDEENTHRIIGGEIYLENSERFIEISKETFKEYFKEVT